MKIFRITVFFYLLLLSAFSFSAKKVELINSYMTTGERETTDQYFKREEKYEFKHSDTVFYFSNFTWENIEKSGGRHKAYYKWYSNGKPVGAPKWKGKFKTAPWEMHSYIRAGTLGYGNHKVEMYLDENLIDTIEFTITK